MKISVNKHKLSAFLTMTDMSSSTPDLIPSSRRVQHFFKRNDVFIYINRQLFFAGRAVDPHKHRN